MRLYRALLAFDIVLAVIAGAFCCVIGAGSLAAGHLDGEDLLLWPPLIAFMAATIGAGRWLKANRTVGAANAVLALLAVPGVLAGAALLLLLAALLRPGAFR